jgi:hypothetical protein
MQDDGSYRDLDLTGTDISDLTPLQGLKILEISISGTKVTDLSPLTNSPIDSLAFVGCPITDFTPLAVLPLRAIEFSPQHIPQLIDILRHKDLYWINGDGNLFWQEYDICHLAEKHDAVALVTATNVTVENANSEIQGVAVAYYLRTFVLGSISNKPLPIYTGAAPASYVPSVGDTCLLFLSDGSDHDGHPVAIPWWICRATDEKLQRLKKAAEQSYREATSKPEPIGAASKASHP